MLEFVAAKRRFVVHLRAEDVHEALARGRADGGIIERPPALERDAPIDAEAVADALTRLVEWGISAPIPTRAGSRRSRTSTVLGSSIN
jgi:hypothetical protein